MASPLVCAGYANSECVVSGLSHTNAHCRIYTLTHKGPLIQTLVDSIRIYCFSFVPRDHVLPVPDWKQTI